MRPCATRWRATRARRPTGKTIAARWRIVFRWSICCCSCSGLPEQEDAVRNLIDDLHSADSPKFHQWLTAEEFGRNYAPAPEDVDKITAWLESHGFTVNLVYPSGMVIDFSGTASQVRQAFHTPIHRFQVNGKLHIANASDPQIPAAFAPVVAGVVSMHDFQPHSMKAVHRDYTYISGGNPYQAVVPADLATIYDLNPLFSKGYTGKGQTIAVIEDADSVFHHGLVYVPLHLRTLRV